MITSFKINDYDIFADSRAVVQISGLTPTDSAPSTATSGGIKRITATVRNNRRIQLTGWLQRDIEGFLDDLYSNWFVGETLTFEIVSNEETYKEQCIIKDIYVDRYKPLVTFTIQIECYSPYLYQDIRRYETNAGEISINLAKCDINQNNILITHTIQAGETSFTVDFYGETIIEYDADYEGQILVVDCAEQTCMINDVNKFYLVSSWQSGENAETAIVPSYTTVEYKRMVRGVW